MGKLLLARHHESEWNKEGRWTGLRDRHLTDYGFEKSNDMGLLIKDIKIDQAFASMQVRAIETLSCMLNVCERYNVPTEHSAALNERNYGDYTGLNKWEIEKEIGEEQFKQLRRGWDHPIPNGPFRSIATIFSRMSSKTRMYWLSRMETRSEPSLNTSRIFQTMPLRIFSSRSGRW
jgi:bisphosphoglycerate-dependent phosphoglycerate mutase family 1